MNRILAAGMMAGATALSGCSSDDDPRQAYCTGFGNGAVFASTCTNCAFNGTHATDGNLVTASPIVPNPGQTTETTTLRATSVADIPGGGDGVQEQKHGACRPPTAGADLAGGRGQEGFRTG